MRESSLVPTNLLGWPRVESLSSQDKYILQALWSARWITCAGCGELPVVSFAAALGVSDKQVRSGIQTLISRGLVVFDPVTSELFILDWFRFHKFRKPNSARILAATVERIQSDDVRKLVSEKSSSCVPTASASATASATELSTAPPRGEREKQPLLDSDSGLITENERDRVASERLVADFGLEKVRAVSATLPMPYPSKVRMLLEGEE